jgi:hypothetical protein
MKTDSRLLNAVFWIPVSIRSFQFRIWFFLTGSRISLRISLIETGAQRFSSGLYLLSGRIDIQGLKIQSVFVLILTLGKGDLSRYKVRQLLINIKSNADR